MKEIRIVIGKGGEVNLDVSGVKGTACSDLTKSLETALGQVKASKKKPEYYQQGQGVSKKQTLGN